MGFGRRYRKASAARRSGLGATSDRHPIGTGETFRLTAIIAESEREPVFSMTAARWFSTARWPMPKKVVGLSMQRPRLIFDDRDVAMRVCRQGCHNSKDYTEGLIWHL